MIDLTRSNFTVWPSIDVRTTLFTSLLHVTCFVSERESAYAENITTGVVVRSWLCGSFGCQSVDFPSRCSKRVCSQKYFHSAQCLIQFHSKGPILVLYQEVVSWLSIVWVDWGCATKGWYPWLGSLFGESEIILFLFDFDWTKKCRWRCAKTGDVF